MNRIKFEEETTGKHATLVKSIEIVSRVAEQTEDSKPVIGPLELSTPVSLFSSIKAVSNAVEPQIVLPSYVDTLKVKDIEKGIYDIVYSLRKSLAVSTNMMFPTSTQKLIGRHLDENLHSDFIAALLLTSVVGNFASEFLAKILNINSKNVYQFAYREVRLDDLDPNLSGRPMGARRIDVLVHTPEIVLVIENKIGSRELENQTLHYGCVVRKRYGGHRKVFLVLLSPNGMSAVNTEFQSLDYKGLYKALISTMENMSIGEDTKMPVESYIRCLIAAFIGPELQALQLSIDWLKERGYDFQ